MTLDGDIALIDIFKMLTVTAVAIAILFPKKKEYEYTSLDERGVLLNIVLSIIYVPMSFAGICTAFFTDDLSAFSSLQKDMLYDVIGLGISIPVISIISILASVILRKRGMSKAGFYIQFLPIIVFLGMVIMFFVTSLIG